MGQSFPSSRGLVIGGVPCGMNSPQKASSLLLLQVWSCFSLAWSLSHSRDLLARSLVLPYRARRLSPMRFLITGTDICGQIVLRRETAADALRKAAELAQDGYQEISITAPNGHKYPSQKFDQLPEDD
jgi:hypothetical protein